MSLRLLLVDPQDLDQGLGGLEPDHGYPDTLLTLARINSDHKTCEEDNNIGLWCKTREILPLSSFTSKWRPGFLCLTNRSALAESRSYLALPSTKHHSHTVPTRQAGVRVLVPLRSRQHSDIVTMNCPDPSPPTLSSSHLALSLVKSYLLGLKLGH